MNTELYSKIVEAGEKRIPVWLTTVIAVKGSTPARVGMKMLVYEDGAIVGTIGGGDIERRVIERIKNEKPELTSEWKYDLGIESDNGEKTSMECGGIQIILVEKIGGGDKLYIIGGGHCGKALVDIASKAGFSVTVIDEREEWANKEQHPLAYRIILSPYSKAVNNIEFSSDIFIVIMTHGHSHDEEVLRQSLGKQYRYLGMIGSNKKVRGVLEKLRKEGYSVEQLRNVFSPIGFEIGSHTPEEIAVSITAQMIAVKNGRKEIPFNSNPFNR